MADFDWVGARLQCSVAIVFARLRQTLKRDVEQRDRAGGNYAFLFHSEAHSIFVSRRDARGNSQTISFVETPDAIGVTDDEKEMFVATLTLNNDGECRLLVNGQELTEWQFRKMALEKLFFGS